MDSYRERENTGILQTSNGRRRHNSNADAYTVLLFCRDSFSGMKVYPSALNPSPMQHYYVANDHHLFTTSTGKGRLFVRGDSKIFRFSSSKNESLFLQRKNPRKIAWTVVYRRVNRKGVSEEVAKKRSRRTVKAQRGVGGLSLADIAARRS